MRIKRALWLLICLWTCSAHVVLAVDKEQLYQSWPQPVENQPFTEERFDELLEIKSVYQGRFHFENAQSFAIEYLSPIKGSLRLKNDLLVIDFPQRKLQTGLNQLPEVAQFLAPLQNLISGRPQALETNYQVSVETLSTEAWQMVLEPKSTMNLTASRITVTGKTVDNQTRVQSIKLDFNSGDWRLYRLKDE